MPADLDLLQGAWAITALEIDGTAMLAGGRIIIKGSKFTTEAMGADYRGVVTAEDGKIDLKFTTGPEKGNTCLGIYKLKGDTLRLCLTLTATKRPTKFKTAPGSGLALETLQREAGRPTKAPESVVPATLEPVPELDGTWQLVAATMNGQSLEDEYVKSGTRIGANNEFRVVMMGQTMLRAHFTVNRATTPTEIDYFVHGPKNRIVPQFGIWKLEDGVLTTAIGAPGQPRPTTFGPGPAVTFTIWQRTSEC